MKIAAICKLKYTIATKAIKAITNAKIGNNGNKGTLKGLCKSGSFLRKAKNDAIETMYKDKAPKQAMVMISPVFPVQRAKIPTSIFTINATAGVLNFL